VLPRAPFVEATPEQLVACPWRTVKILAYATRDDRGLPINGPEVLHDPTSRRKPWN
jgi:hypothetical protein